MEVVDIFAILEVVVGVVEEVRVEVRLRLNVSWVVRVRSRF